MRSPLLVLMAAAGYFVLAASATRVLAVGPNKSLNDTGVNAFSSGTYGSSSLLAEPPTHPRQDASQGRDGAARVGTLAKIGGGSKGFDFTKISNDGNVLSAIAAIGTAGSDWGCVRDNVTGLTWEVKAAAPDQLRSAGHTYTWYSSDATTNGGEAGVASGGVCQTAGRCDTEKFVQDVNAVGLCGHVDWRMPTLKELHSIADLGAVPVPGPAIDSVWFPNTLALYYWSSTPYGLSSAWYVNFDGGDPGQAGTTSGAYKGSAYPVRLVRAGP